MASQSLADLMYQYFTSGNAGTLPGPGSNNSNPVTSAPIDQDGIQNSNKAAAPVANAVIATITVPAGTWDVYYDAYVDGTDAVADVFNMNLRVTGTARATLLYSTKTEPKGQIMIPFRIKSAGGDTITINAVGAATAGTTYYGLLSAVRVR
jgi:hypothetical protein